MNTPAQETPTSTCSAEEAMRQAEQQVLNAVHHSESSVQYAQEEAQLSADKATQAVERTDASE